MFKKNDKSLFIVRKVVNVAIFVLMCACVICGIAVIASAISGPSYYLVANIIIGVVVLLGGPIFLQILWLIIDVKFNALVDIKLIRNATYNQEEVLLPAPLFHKNKKEEDVITNGMEVYEKIKKYKLLLDEKIITTEEFEDIKSRLLLKPATVESCIDSSIKKVKVLKSYADDNIISAKEFEEEKAKLLKK